MMNPKPLDQGLAQAGALWVFMDQENEWIAQGYVPTENLKNSESYTLGVGRDMKAYLMMRK